jgi:Protein of unknown function (DUF1580)
MLNISSDQYVSLRQAAKLIPSRPHVSTLWRWMFRGVRGRKLKSTLIGGHRFLAIADIEQFLQEINSPCTESNVTKTSLSAIESAEKELRKRGL